MKHAMPLPVLNPARLRSISGTIASSPTQWYASLARFIH